MKLSDNIEKRIKQTNIKTNTDMDKVVLGNAVRVMSKSRKKTNVYNRPGIWRIIMTSRITKLSAVMIFIAALIGLHRLGSSIDGTGIVWADVAERLENVRTFKAQAHRIFTEVGKDEPVFKCEVFKYFSPDHGFMEKQYIDGKTGMLAYGLVQEEKLIVVFPQMKQYYHFAFNKEILSLIEFMNHANPDGIMKQFGSERCTRLASKEINGVMAEGFEVKDVKILSGVPRFLFKLESVDIRLWVNYESLLPIKLECEGFVGKGLLTGFKNLVGKEEVYNIEYDVEIDKSIFEPNIPEDYKLIEPANIIQKTEIIMFCILPFTAFMFLEDIAKPHLV